MGPANVTPTMPSRRKRAILLALVLTYAGAADAIDRNPVVDPAPVRIAQSNLPPANLPGDPVDSGDAAALVVRVDRLESDLRRANGQIEELQNANHRLEDQLKRFREDVEFRLKGTAGAPPTATALAPEPAPTSRPRKNDAFDPSADPNAAGAPKPLGTTLPSAPLTLAPPSPASAPLDLASRPPPTGPLKPSDAATPTVITSGVGFTDGPREQYNAAIEAYRNGQYAEAETQLRAFLAANATHRLAPDATFYLGETFLQRSRPREAAEQYLKLSTDFGKSARAPEGMMRLGQSLAMLGNAEQACATFAEVGKRYPAAPSSVRHSIEREMQKDHC